MTGNASRGISLTAVLLGALVFAGCGTAATAASPSARATAPAAGAAGDRVQARADAFATVAQRLYRQETLGQPGKVSAARIAGDQKLLRALESGDRAAIRAEALYQLFLPAKHVVRLRVVKAGRTIVDVGGAFVAASESHALRAPDGTYLGRLDVSMQDILGLTKLEERFTGAGIVVHGRSGHVQASARALANARIPASGPAQIGGRTYMARSFDRTGWNGEPLRISILVPG
ncbi:MAG: hypothetical protein QOC68_4406 [Solirubrobacteraceae bacterium]|jgi:hypothetical protein|nr:hypothetical protein [Solirubrobacteraceae bacterium]